MRLLAFDTSSSACSVALLDTHENVDAKITSMHKMMPMQQGQLILPMIETILTEAGLQLHQLDAIAYGCGPGSFTGVRVASSVAQGIGFVAECQVISISSLAAIAQAAYLEQQWSNMLVALDARMGEVYWAWYQANESGLVELQGCEAVSVPEEVNLREKCGEWAGIGDGWNHYGDRLKTRLGVTPTWVNLAQLPTAEAVLQLARIKFARRDWVKADEAMPNYLR